MATTMRDFSTRISVDGTSSRMHSSHQRCFWEAERVPRHAELNTSPQQSTPYQHKAHLCGHLVSFIPDCEIYIQQLKNRTHTTRSDALGGRTCAKAHSNLHTPKQDKTSCVGTWQAVYEQAVKHTSLEHFTHRTSGVRMSVMSTVFPLNAWINFDLFPRKVTFRRFKMKVPAEDAQAEYNVPRKTYRS